MNRTLSKGFGASLLIVGSLALMPLSALADHEHHRHHHEREHHRDHDRDHGRDRDRDRDQHEYQSIRSCPQPQTVWTFGLNVGNPPPRYCPEPVEYCAPRVYYYDPYCGERFATFELYVQHQGRRRHPAYVRVRGCDDDGDLYAYRSGRSGWVRCRF